MEKMAEKRRIVLVPLPVQGHITPMMQLGEALNLKGFSITVAQGEFSLVSSSNHLPGFQFVTIPNILPLSQVKSLEPVKFLLKLNQTSEAGFKDCIAQLLLQQDNDISCIIYDDLMYFCGSAAKEFNLTSFIFRTTSATHSVCCSVLSKLDAKKFLIDMKDHEVQEKVVENLYPLRYKYLPTWGFEPLDQYLELCREVVNKRRASGVINNTASCLESSSLLWLQQELGVQVYPLGPLHITASENYSLLEEDMRCIEWLNKQKPKSVIYISMGSIAQIETNEVLEMAWGLFNTNQPFLWVTRSGSILGSDEESLPDELSNMVSERGYIVKWAPQREVLAHPAVGGFWSHCGWNSTLESIVEGVPMICRPFDGEQKLNAVYIESVWSVGIQLEGEVEREYVEKAVKRLFVDEEGEDMRKRALDLKEKLKASVRNGGSSYKAFDELVKYLKTK